jgi:hypothetical protein
MFMIYVSPLVVEVYDPEKGDLFRRVWCKIEAGQVGIPCLFLCGGYREADRCIGRYSSCGVYGLVSAVVYGLLGLGGCMLGSLP